MRSATAFLPSSMTTFMNLASSTLPNLGSGRISRLGTSRRRGILLPCVSSVEPCHLTWPRPPIGTAPYVPRTVPARGWRGCTVLAALARSRVQQKNGKSVLGLLRTLGAVLGASLLAILDALQVERAAHDVITHTRQILDTTAAHQHHRLLLHVV